MFRIQPDLEVLLIHPGGPYFAAKDKGFWGIPKGEYDPEEEEPLTAAIREFREETGFTAAPPFLPLGEIRQRNRKLVTAWAFAGDCDPANLVSETCQIRWPPRSGRIMQIPEADEGRWFGLSAAREYMRADQHTLLDRLTALLVHPSLTR